MAESSMKDIKLRIKSVESTRQITKAMQLVATSKMRRTKARMEGSRPYADIASDALSAAAAGCTGGKVHYITPREIKRRCFVVVAGDRGLAGGYNNNIFKQVAASCEDGVPFTVLPVGRKALEKYSHMGVELAADHFLPVAGMPVGSCQKMANLLCEGYREGRYDEVILVYTDFKSMLTQEVRTRRLLPLTPSAVKDTRCSTQFDPDPETVVERIVPGVVAGELFSAICDAAASENAARRNAMESATKNADEMISSLHLKYNRARQGSITQEITEIVAGAEK